MNILSQAKQDTSSAPSVTRPPLEENIVLGVALEGAKRTLPIEEEEIAASSSMHAETKDKELAGSRNGAGSSPPIVKEKKDGQMPE